MKKNLNPIYIPFQGYQWIGGPTTFMQNLQTYLDRHNFSYLPSFKDAKIFFVVHTCPVSTVDKIKSQGGYIIQRLGGTYYPSKHGEKYIELNQNAKKIYLDYADAVIFQNQYCRDQCFEMFGRREDYQIIVNGTDKSIFYPAQSQKNTRIQGRIQFVTTGRFRNIDMIEPVVKALDLVKNQLDFEFKVIGPVVNPSLKPYFQRSYLRHIETLSLSEIAEVLRTSDVFIYSHLNPPCPNSIVEAVSCGIPIVGFDSGSMAELCFFSKELLAHISNDIFQRYEDFDYRRLAEKILFVVKHYERYKLRALKHSHLYSFEECGKRYMEVFETYLKKPRRIIPFFSYKVKKFLYKRLRRYLNRE